jgi:Rrf2 family protein
MRISTRSRYGLRLLMELTRHDDGKPVFLNEIARNQDISEKYLSKLVIPLRGAGLVQSARGAHGGYVLGKKPELITLREIIDCLEGGLGLIDCADNPKLCPRSRDCASRDVWSGLEKVMRDYCAALTLAQVARTGAQGGYAEFI